MFHHVRGRLAAGFVATALVAGGVTLGAGTPASAATASADSVRYTCDGLLGLLPLTDIPLDISEVGDVSGGTIPIGGTLDVGLVAELLGSVTSAVDTLVLSNTAIPLRLEPAADAVSSLLAGHGIPLVGGLPLPDPLPSGGLPLPHELDLGSLVCTLVGTLDTLPLPSLPGLPGDNGGDSGGTGTTGGTGDGGSTVGTPTHHTGTHAKRTPNLHATPKKKRVHHRAHPRVKVTVRKAGEPVAGRIQVRIHGRIIGHAHLHNGRAVISLKKLARGKRTVKVVYQGTSTFKRVSQKVTFRILK